MGYTEISKTEATLLLCGSSGERANSAIQFGTLHHNGLQLNTIKYNTVQYSTVQYNTVQCNTVQCSTVQCNTVQCNTVQCNTVQCNTVQYNEIPIRLRTLCSLSMSHCPTVRIMFLPLN